MICWLRNLSREKREKKSFYFEGEMKEEVREMGIVYSMYIR